MKTKRCIKEIETELRNHPDFCGFEHWGVIDIQTVVEDIRDFCKNSNIPLHSSQKQLELLVREKRELIEEVIFSNLNEQFLNTDSNYRWIREVFQSLKIE